MKQKIAEVFHALPLQIQADTAIFANDYGEAAAIDFFGPRYGLPASISKGIGSGVRVSMIARASSSLAAMPEATMSFSVQSNLRPCGGPVFSRRRTVHHLPL
jgi:hypothetical protein